MIGAWLSRYVQRVTVADVPTVERCANHISPPSSNHVAASPVYRICRARTASPMESNSKMQSYKKTTSGAVTIDSFDAMPSAHDMMAAAFQRAALVDRLARIAQY